MSAIVFESSTGKSGMLGLEGQPPAMLVSPEPIIDHDTGDENEVGRPRQDVVGDWLR